VTIEAIKGGKWSAKAAAADACERVPHDAEFIAIWVHEGKISWSKTECTAQGLCLLATAVNEMAARFIRSNFD
jgi:hypothetical protein